MTKPAKPSLFERPAPSRRGVLRAAGVALALPALPSLVRPARAGEHAPPRRMLAICNNLGILPRNFFPEGTGRDWKPSRYLEVLARFRDDLTVFSGVSHPDVDGGHPADNCFLTAAPHPASGGFKNTISLDQFAAQYLGHLTRFPTLTLGVNQSDGQRSLSWTAGGVLIPCEQKPSALYAKLFLAGDASEVQAQMRRLELGRSVMDVVGEQAKRLAAKTDATDRERLDQYFTAVRDLEGKLVAARAWEKVPRPKTSAPPPADVDEPKRYMDKARLMYEMARLAFETDSSRLVTLMLDGVSTPPMYLPGVTLKDSYHNLSHHGHSEDKLEQLEQIDLAHFRLLGELLGGLTAVKEDGVRLLDRTMVLYGSNMGDANSHVTTNLPVLFAGGGFKHGQHLAFDTHTNHPLPNLFVSMLQRLGIGTDRFASGATTMRGLEATG
jgi:hypothetical protein